MSELYIPIIHYTSSIISLPRGLIFPVFAKYVSSTNYGNLVASRTSWSEYLIFGNFQSISSTVTIASGRYGSVMSMTIARQQMVLPLLFLCPLLPSQSPIGQ
jgi:hypothetical protein